MWVFHLVKMSESQYGSWEFIPRLEASHISSRGKKDAKTTRRRPLFPMHLILCRELAPIQPNRIQWISWPRFGVWHASNIILRLSLPRTLSGLPSFVQTFTPLPDLVSGVGVGGGRGRAVICPPGTEAKATVAAVSKAPTSKGSLVCK